MKDVIVLDKNILYKCMWCGEEEVHPNGRDGIRGKCGGHLQAVGFIDKPSFTNKPSRPVREKKKDEIVIKLTHANEPPQVFIGGKKVAVVNLDLNYKTDDKELGVHDFSMIYEDKSNDTELGKGYTLAGFRR